jgi:hypothetical protein
MTSPSLTRRSALLIVLATASYAQAQTGPELLLKPFAARKSYDISARSAYFFDAESKDLAGNPDVQVNTLDINGRMKLDFDFVDKSINRAQPRAGFSLQQLVVDVDGLFLPKTFTDLSVGAGIGIGAGEKWKAGIVLGVGYAGAGAFGDGNAWYGMADLAIGIDLDERSSLGIVLSYDGNRSFLPDVPLPGFIYTYRLNTEFTLGVGVPFSNLVWTPDNKWRIELTYLFPDSAAAKVEYKVSNRFGLYGELAADTYSYHWDGIPDGGDRVFYHQNRVEFGLSGYLTDTTDYRFTVAGGYAFGQSFETGWSRRDADTITDLDSVPYIRLDLEARF